MKKLLALTLFLCGGFVYSNAQVKIKNGLVSVDGKEFVKITDETATNSTLRAIESDSELVYLSLVDPSPNASSDFNDNYYMIRFPVNDAEIKFKDFRKNVVIKFIYDYKIIENGRYNKAKLDAFIGRFAVKE